MLAVLTGFSMKGEKQGVCCREIQPLETRAAGAGINVASNMLFTFVIGQCFTTMLCSMRYGVFLFFAGVPYCSAI